MRNTADLDSLMKYSELTVTGTITTVNKGDTIPSQPFSLDFADLTVRVVDVVEQAGDVKAGTEITVKVPMYPPDDPAHDTRIENLQAHLSPELHLFYGSPDPRVGG